MPSEVAIDVAVPRAFLAPWILQVDLPRVMRGTERVAGVARVEMLAGTWPYVGARRRVVFEDQTTALEELTAVTMPEGFAYTVWNFTNDARRVVDHIEGSFRFESREATTHVVWTYRFVPRGWPSRWLVATAVEDDFRPFMVQSLAAMGVEATRAYRASVPSMSGR